MGTRCLCFKYHMSLVSVFKYPYSVQPYIYIFGGVTNDYTKGNCSYHLELPKHLIWREVAPAAQ